MYFQKYKQFTPCNVNIILKMVIITVNVYIYYVFSPENTSPNITLIVGITFSVIGMSILCASVLIATICFWKWDKIKDTDICTWIFRKCT